MQEDILGLINQEGGVTSLELHVMYGLKHREVLQIVRQLKSKGHSITELKIRTNDIRFFVPKQ
jgi:hypothetical protein